MHFAKLDDSPMFRQQIQGLEESAESLRGRCYKFYKGCRKHTYDEKSLDLLMLSAMIKELKTLCDECRSNSCIEHATGIMEELQAPENLSKKISNINLTGVDKKVEFLLEKLDVYESAVGDANVKSAPRIEAFPPPFQSIPRNPIVLDLAYNHIDFPSLQHRMKKDKSGGFLKRFWG